MSELCVSVVVATHDRPLRLERLFAGLRGQVLPAGAFEVVVVDDGSGPQARSVIEREAARGELRLRPLRHERARGPGAARNAGWRVAQAALVAFTDDDCVPDPRWLSEGVEAHSRVPGAVVQGRTEPDPTEDDQRGLFSRTVQIRSLGPQYETCNIFYPRELLEQLGGFDEHFGLAPGGEDTDLAWRAIARGRETVFAESAVVHHAVERLGPAGSLRVAARWAETMRIFAVHPGTRSALTRGLFWNPWHYLMARSLLALLLPPWARRLVLARHLLQLRRRARREGAAAWAVPYLLLYDLVEMVAVVRGAIRYRTPVL